VEGVRAAADADLDRLATIWHEGWHEAHAQLLPQELAGLRTLESFRDRLAAALSTATVVGPPGGPVGFCMVKGNELYQLYVSPLARGSGAAAALMADTEARLAAEGVETAWLACAIGNDRAARFDEKAGWQRAGTRITEAETSLGPFPVEVWRYEKRLRENGYEERKR
jgi:GNAT superfamily N-acetyltransferase